MIEQNEAYQGMAGPYLLTEQNPIPPSAWAP